MHDQLQNIPISLDVLAHLGPDWCLVFGISLNGKVQYRLLVFMLKQSVDNQRMLGITSLHQRPWYPLDPQLHPSPHLNTVLSPSLFCPSSSPLVILKLEDLGIVERQVLVRVPRRSSETLQSTISLESSLCQSISRRIHFVGEMQIVRVFLVSLFSVGL